MCKKNRHLFEIEQVVCLVFNLVVFFFVGAEITFTKRPEFYKLPALCSN
ncbi:hypothetical protein QWZ13_07790 [Reinekea marina]|nr:hypothetical protein [Reinekea marina]MDN3648809.1 hypothetical protein [Reinekea marina]